MTTALASTRESGAILTARLALLPLTPRDAAEMVDVLGDARLHKFIGGRPATLPELAARYRRLAIGRSSDGAEAWHNWVVRTHPAREAVGTVQATVTDDGRTAAIAWVIGVSWQGRGFGSEAARALVEWLRRRGVETIEAHVHPGHVASETVARRAGLVVTQEWVDGERVWRWRGSAAWRQAVG